MFYHEKYDGKKYNYCKNCNISGINHKVYVFGSTFIGQTSGAISIICDDIKFLHSSCFFNRCSKARDGGAVQFAGNSSIIQHRFCTMNTVAFNGFHSRVDLGEKSEKDNFAIEFSISSCQNSENTDVIALIDGNCGIYSSNISKNLANIASGFGIAPSIPDSVINFSNFVNNIAPFGCCLFYLGVNKGRIRNYFCNVISNTQDSLAYGVINVVSEVYFNNCTILGPIGKRGKLFKVDRDGNITVVNCNIDEYYSYTTNYPNNFITTSNLIRTSSMQYLRHSFTFECNEKTQPLFQSEPDITEEVHQYIIYSADVMTYSLFYSNT